MSETVTIRDRIFERCPECKRYFGKVRCRYCGKPYKVPHALFTHEQHCASNPEGICRISARPYSECTEDNEWQHQAPTWDEGETGTSSCLPDGSYPPWCERYRRDNLLLAEPDPTLSKDYRKYVIDPLLQEIRATMTPDAVKPPWWEEGEKS